MKKILLLTWCFTTFTCICFAQDVIVTMDSKRINARVLEIDDANSMIRYRLFEERNGPTYKISTGDVEYIRFQDGEIERFNTANPNRQTVPSTPAQTQNQRSVSSSQDDGYGYRNQGNTPNYYSKKDKLSLMSYEAPDLYWKYTSGRSKQRKGNALLIAGGATLIGGAIFLAYGDTRYDEGYEDEADTAYTLGAVAIVTGTVLLSVGLPISIVGTVQKNTAWNQFDRRRYGLTPTTPHLNLNLHGNGLGLALVF